mgnify:CR=1 FL=1
MRNEISYYNEIQEFIEIQLKSNFLLNSHRNLYVYWGIGELKNNLYKIIKEHPVECSCALQFAKRIPPLNLDIFALITDGKRFELLILEIKLVKSAGLREWSQLVGYCLVSGARYGLLVNIDHGSSERLTQTLSNEYHMSHIHTVVNNNNKEHMLGFMQWNSLTHNFEYTNLGFIRSLSDLSNKLISAFAD